MNTLRATIFLTLGVMLAAGCETTTRPVAYTSSDPVPVAPHERHKGRQASHRTPEIQPHRSQHVIAVPTAWRPRATAQPWRYIVIHHSATTGGNARTFDRAHRSKGWDELGYHFVVGNGHGSRDGFVEVGPRWTKQKHGAHAKTADNRYNQRGIGICLVGNFDNKRPTPAQQAALTKLVAYLMHEHNIPASNVIGHRDTKPTACPGRNMNVAVVRNQALRTLAAANLPAPDGPALTAAEIDEIDWDHPEEHVHHASTCSGCDHHDHGEDAE
ncbi:MAG: peptidoglycan recognition family protein [Planctomycetota bacterium]